MGFKESVTYIVLLGIVNVYIYFITSPSLYTVRAFVLLIEY